MMDAGDLRVEIDRLRFKLRVYAWSYKRVRYVRVVTFKVALGAINFGTPSGPYKVVGKSKTPDWAPPDWSGIDEEVIPFEDPRNPFDGGFISLGGHPSIRGDGIGIHGTKFDPQLGTRASHGCIRMEVPDLLKLWLYTPVGTPVTVYGEYREEPEDDSS